MATTDSSQRTVTGEGCGDVATSTGEVAFPLETWVLAHGGLAVREGAFHTSPLVYVGDGDEGSWSAESLAESTTDKQAETQTASVDGAVSDDGTLSGTFVFDDAKTDVATGETTDCRQEIAYTGRRLADAAPLTGGGLAGAWLASFDLASTVDGPACADVTRTWTGATAVRLDLVTFDDGAAAASWTDDFALAGTWKGSSGTFSSTSTSTATYGYDQLVVGEDLSLSIEIHGDEGTGTYAVHELQAYQNDSEPFEDCTTTYAVTFQRIVAAP